MIKTLERIGIRGNTLIWFKSYLECRSYCVKINFKSSNKISYDCGVPQRSKLGLIFYIILYMQVIYLNALIIAVIVANKSFQRAVEKMQQQLDDANKTKAMQIKPPRLVNCIILKFDDMECFHSQSSKISHSKI